MAYVDILIRYEDPPGVPDSPGKWYPGMIIDAREFPGGMPWGTLEPDPPRTVMLRVNNVTLETLQPYLTELTAEEGETDALGNPVPTLKGRRAQKINFSTVPPPIKTQLEAGVVYEIDWNIMGPWLINHGPPG